MARPDWIPFADRVETPNGGYSDHPVLNPTAIVPHSSHGPLNSDPPRRFYETEKGWWGSPGCTHLWIYGHGSLTQLVKLSKPAWGNGWLNRPDGLQSPKELVRGWYRDGRNPNYDTISCEFAGYGLQAPNTSPLTMESIPPTDEQMATWFRVTGWLKAEGWLTELTEQNVILHREISKTACPDGRFESADMIVRPLESTDKEESFEGFVTRSLAEHGKYLNDLNIAAWNHKAGKFWTQHNQPRP